MILVDINVPSIDKYYDFLLNENTPIASIIDEITEMIGQKEKTFISGDVKQLDLCNATSEEVLNKGMSLNECNIKTGDSLILI